MPNIVNFFLLIMALAVIFIMIMIIPAWKCGLVGVGGASLITAIFYYAWVHGEDTDDGTTH